MPRKYCTMQHSLRLMDMRSPGVVKLTCQPSPLECPLGGMALPVTACSQPRCAVLCSVWLRLQKVSVGVFKASRV